MMMFEGRKVNKEIIEKRWSLHGARVVALAQRQGRENNYVPLRYHRGSRRRRQTADINLQILRGYQSFLAYGLRITDWFFNLAWWNSVPYSHVASFLSLRFHFSPKSEFSISF